MFKRIGVALAAAVVGVVALAAPAATAPEPRFTLQIDPAQGPVGTTIHTQVPEEATAAGGECLSPSEIFAGLQKVAGTVIGQGDPSPAVKGLLEAITKPDNLQQLGPDSVDLTLFFVLAFADPVTQRPAIDETTGEESATGFWDSTTGAGEITAPPAKRPGNYFVAALCLDLNTNPDPAALAGAVQKVVDGGASGSDAVQKAATALLTPLIDQDAKVAWVAPFCLTGDNGEPCSSPAGEGATGEATAAEPVTATPKFTG
jgi:hypothetical protein